MATVSTITLSSSGYGADSTVANGRVWIASTNTVVEINPSGTLSATVHTVSFGATPSTLYARGGVVWVLAANRAMAFDVSTSTSDPVNTGSRPAMGSAAESSGRAFSGATSGTSIFEHVEGTVNIGVLADSGYDVACFDGSDLYLHRGASSPRFVTKVDAGSLNESLVGTLPWARQGSSMFAYENDVYVVGATSIEFAIISKSAGFAGVDFLPLLANWAGVAQTGDETPYLTAASGNDILTPDVVLGRASHHVGLVWQADHG